MSMIKTSNKSIIRLFGTDPYSQFGVPSPKSTF